MHALGHRLAFGFSAVVAVVTFTMECFAQCTDQPFEKPTKPVACAFDPDALQFKGTPGEQALCLLRPVAIRGEIGSPLKELPKPLNEIVGKPVTQLDKQKFEAFVVASGLSRNSLGGSLADPLSRARENSPSAPFAQYFVIHDTSTCAKVVDKKCLSTEFPPNYDTADWGGNNPKTWATSKDGHLYVTRDGKLVAPKERTFAEPWRATKLELNWIGKSTCGLFLHIENVQPRHTDPKGSKGNDNIAPTPGLTQHQLTLLAMAYIAASLRSGTWLIPAYHAVIDAGFSDGHDDPQNFDLAAWAQQICSSIRQAGGSC